MFLLAILPSIILFIIVWRADKIEKEPIKLLLKLFGLGALTVISALVIGMFCDDVVFASVNKQNLLFILFDNMIVTALVEEAGKYFVLKKVTWKHPEFNYTFDAVVYAVCVSLGFATIENIFYLIDEGIDIAIIRGLLSVPGHVIDAIFMGYYYGLAKCADAAQDDAGRSRNLKLALIVPVLLHGIYDFCISTDYTILLVAFIVFEIVVIRKAIKKFKQLSNEDREISPHEETAEYTVTDEIPAADTYEDDNLV
ncbi:MAG: PrsW family intramembrane metalloprotease [Lachnospiraceae bacterium]|nr:PrsW family intramembrane metalloprotease [Lachnospiraceae bacterium]